MSVLPALAVLGVLSLAPARESPAPPRMVGAGIKEPRKLKNVVPEYPADARRAGLAGIVLLECTIDAQGAVAKISVLRGVPPLSDDASEAVRQWRYEPTVLDGVAVPVIMTVTVDFKIDTVRYRDLLASLDHWNESIREAAAQHLGALRAGRAIDLGDVRDAIGALELVAQHDERPRVRDAAARALSRLDGRPPPAGPPPTSPPPPASLGAGSRPVAWGAFVDPLGQCRIEERGERIEIGVPAGAYDLSIELGQQTAPRLMQPVAGDHAAQVTVEELPEPVPGAVREPRRPYHGAGLLLWQDERSYVRLESAIYRGPDDSSVRYALFEVRKDGALMDGLARPDVRLRSGPTQLRLERRGRGLRALVRQGDEAWREAGRADVDLPTTIAVGVAAVNRSGSALRTGFTRFGLLSDPGPAPSADGVSDASHPAAPGAAPPEEYDSPPRPSRLTRPQYPRAAFAKRIEGTVILEVLIDEKGRVTRRRVIQSVPGLDEAALKCLKDWRFYPARKRGKPVATIAQVPIRFRIVDKKD